MNRAFLVLLTCMAISLTLSAHTHRSPSHKRAYAGEKCWMYRLILSNKNGGSFSLQHPHQFLSHKALERRRRQGIDIDSTDLPVSRKYLQQIEATGVRIKGTSRWHNSVLIETADTSLCQAFDSLSFVRLCTRVWQSPDSVTESSSKRSVHTDFNPWDSIPSSYYASSTEQITSVGGTEIHKRGFNGRGITIAVLDEGFENINRIPSFKYTRIKGQRSFVAAPKEKGYNESDHGTKVFSVMAANAPHVYVGCATAASYWLLQCEDPRTEQQVEEDYWTFAAEFADSVGVDIINSSLGYNEFDSHYADHQLHDLDGTSSFISQSASMLHRKGIALVCSAGNNGMGPWKKISFPADALECITVGAVTTSLQNAPFSSVGPTQDGRIKPDVMAIGSPAYLISGRGALVQDMGTSFAAPLICGMMACLWQALPHLTALQLMQLVRQCGNNAAHANNVYGYGVPNFTQALERAYQLFPPSVSSH